MKKKRRLKLVPELIATKSLGLAAISIFLVIASCIVALLLSKTLAAIIAALKPLGVAALAVAVVLILLAAVGLFFGWFTSEEEVIEEGDDHE